MSEDLQDIDKLFRDQIEAHQELPAGSVWDNIDNDLDKFNSADIRRKYNRLKRFSIALLLLLLGTIVYEIQSRQASSKNAGDNKLSAQQINSNSTTSSESLANSKELNKNSVDNNSSSANQNNTATNNSNPIQENKNAGVDKNNPDIITEELKSNEAGNSKTKSLTKSFTKQKTKISIRNSIAVEDNVDENNLSNNSTEYILSPLAKFNVDEITVNNKPNNLPQLITKRNSPETALNGSGKIKTTRNAKPLHFSLEPFFSPLFSFNRIENDRQDGFRRNDRDFIKSNEQYQTAYAVGINVELPLSKNWSLQSGVTYQSKRIKIEPKEIYADLDDNGEVKYRFDCSSGYSFISPKTGAALAVGDSVNVSTSTNVLSYVAIPLAIKYNFNIGKFSISPVIGSSFNMLVKQKIETALASGTTYQKQTINNIQGLKPSYLNGFGSINLAYNFNRKIAVSLTPTFNAALTSINKNSSVKSYPNSTGVAAGIKIKF